MGKRYHALVSAFCLATALAACRTAPPAVSGAGDGGVSGAAGESGAAPTAGAAGSADLNGHVRTGNSIGCGTNPPPGDSSDGFSVHEVNITGLDPSYLKGGKLYDSSGAYDFSHRPYGVRLPVGYDQQVPVTVTFGSGDCGGSASGYQGGAGFDMTPDGSTLQIGLQYISGCFNDGGPSIDNRPDTPEEPYFRAVMKDIEAHYCIDLSRVFVGGYGSGGWEAYLLGCATADLVRGIGTDEGGLRAVHPTCKNPVAAVMVAGEADEENPIGPLDLASPSGQRLGSTGSGPARDEILRRNGCVGTATAAIADAKYPACKQYTGCPTAYPVVWCSLPGVAHKNSTYPAEGIAGSINYSPGPMWEVLSALPPPS